MSTNENDLTSIAVIGMACRFPGADNPNEFWQLLASGTEPSRELSDADLVRAGVNPETLKKPNYVKRVSRMNNIEMFDAGFFDVTARDASITSPSQRWLLTCAYEAFEDAGYVPGECRGLTGVYVGANRNDDWQKRLYQLSHTDSGEFARQLQLHIANDLDYAATRISYKLNLRGPSINVSTACSTSLVAIHQACRALLSYECDMALAGGGNVLLPLDVGYLFESGGIQSRDGHCRAFDADSDGTIFGSGVGVVLLKRLEDALADGDHIYASVRGSSINNDGASKVGFTAPSVTGQSEVISAAMSMAGVGPDDIDYVETHGTGTALGDPIEVEALTKAYRTKTSRKNYCGIGSVKSNMGHLGAAAGIAGFIKTVLALKHECLPPTLHFRRPNPEIDLDSSPFFVVNQSQEWKTKNSPRLAGVSAFGVGGTNAHLIVEEAPRRLQKDHESKPRLLLLSARSESTLNTLCRNLANYLAAHPDVDLADAAYTLHVGRRRFEHRRTFIAQDTHSAAQLLLDSVAQQQFSDDVRGQEADKVSFLFPGQGAQHINMTLGLYSSDTQFRALVDQCCSILERYIKTDLRKILFREQNDKESDAVLGQTALAQPALFITEYALARRLEEWGIKPASMIGHSIGEYVAACIAGVFSLEDALFLVAERGRLMQSMPAGEMLAVALSEENLRPLLGGCDLAAVNGPEWCVASGSAEVVEGLRRVLAEQNIDHRLLHTSHAFHSSMMEPMLGEFLMAVRKVKFARPLIPYISNVSGDWIKAEQATDPQYWVQHLRGTVRFFQGAAKIMTRDAVLLEVGPGQTLTSLIKTFRGQFDTSRLITCCRHPKQTGNDLEFLLAAVGRMWRAGLHIDPVKFYKRDQPARISLPAYPFELQRHWLESVDQQTVPDTHTVVAGAYADRLPAAAAEQQEGSLSAVFAASEMDQKLPLLKNFVLQKVCALFGLPVVAEDVPLIELGLNSLMAIELRTQINAAMEFDSVSIIDLMDEAATVTNLARNLLESLEKSPAKMSADILAHSASAAADGTPRATDSGHALETSIEDFYIAPDPAGTYQPFSLTAIQQAYWIGRNSKIEGGDIATYIYIENDFSGLDVGRYEEVINNMVQRHHMMRMVVRDDGKQQFLQDVPRYKIVYEDLSELSEAVRGQKLTQIRAAMSHQVMNPAVWPLFEIRVSKIAQNVYRLHYGFDFMIVDALSMMVFFRDSFLMYVGENSRLPALDITFRDYVLFEQDNRETAAYARSKRYWLDRIETLPGAPQLPFAKDAAQITKPRYRRLDFRIDSDTWERLKLNAKRQKITASVLIANAYAEALAQWCQSPKFTLNLTIFNRPRLHPRMNDLMGDFTSSVLLEVDMTERKPFIDSAKQLQRRMLNDLEHRHFNGVEMLRAMNSRSGGYQSVIMPVVLTSVLGLDQHSEILLGGLNPEQRETYEQMVNHGYTISQTSQVWLDHVVREQNGELICNWDALEELFPARVLDDMFTTYYDRLIQLANESDAAWLNPRPVHLPAYQERRRQAVNNTHAPLRNDLLQELFGTSVEKYSNRIAIINRTHRITYAELSSVSRQLGWALRDLLVKPNELVAIVMDKGWEQIAAVFGVLYSGAAYMPVDAGLPHDRVLHLLQQGEVKVALTQAHLFDKIEWPENIRPIVVDDRALVNIRSQKEAPPALQPVQVATDLAYVLFTSGSTGIPKGVMIDHQSVVNTVLDINRRFGIGMDDRAIAINALNFDLSVYDIFGLLAVGGALVIPDYTQLYNPAHWVELVQREEVSIWNTVPAIVQLYVEELEENPLGAKATGLNKLRYIFMSGDWIPVDLPDRIRQVLPNTAPISLGGPTETTVWSIYYPIGKVEPHWKSIPYGKPLTHRLHEILHSDLSPCPEWVVGDLYTGGQTGLARGYWHDEEKTRQVFIQHPTTGQRLYRTGDLGRFLPDGNIEFIGRVDNQIKIQGHRIELGEIEFALRQCESVQDAVVVAVGDDAADAARANRRLVAFVVDKAAKEDAENKALLNDQNILTDPLKIAVFKLEQHGIRRFNPIPECVQLPRSSEHNRRLPLAQTIYEDRNFDPTTPLRWLRESIDRDSFGDWLSCLGQVHLPDHTMPKYYFPSPGSAHPIQTYLYVRDGVVKGIAAGVYYYDPSHHRLVCLARTEDAALRYGSQWQERLFCGDLANSGFALFFLSYDDAVEPLYGKHKDERFYAIEAGHIEYLLTAMAHSRGMALSHHFGVDAEVMKDLLAVDERYRFVSCMLGGVAHQKVERKSVALDCMARQSYRTFSQSGIAREDLESLFATLSPIDGNRPVAAHDGASLDIYVYVKPGRVENMRAGFYKFAIDSARWSSVYLLDDEPLPKNPHYTRNRAIHEGSAFSVFFVAPCQETKARVASMLFAGYLSQALLNVCTDWKIGLCSLAGANQAVLANYLPFENESDIVYCLEGGGITAEQMSHWITENLQGDQTQSLEQRWKESLVSKLPYYMVPAAFVRLEQFPLTRNGKVDRKALTATQVTLEQKKKNLVEARDDVERSIVEIWRRLLDVDSVSVEDNLFELGGDSLVATKMISEINKILGVNVLLHEIFSDPTVAGLARRCKSLLEQKMLVSEVSAQPELSHSDSASASELIMDLGKLSATLMRDARLHPDIRPQGTIDLDPAQAKNIFLTGATGFLGAYVLRELLDRTTAEIHCLARANKSADALTRIRQNMRRYGLWNDSDLLRINAIEGDLAKPQFGLADTAYNYLCEHVDLIYHVGSQVNYARSYEDLKKTNVLGAESIIRLACRHKTKYVNVVSSKYVCFGLNDKGLIIHREEAPVTDAAGVIMGYTQSKWVAESLFEQAKNRGVPVTIVRPGQITGAQHHELHMPTDAFHELLKLFVAMKIIPTPGEWQDGVIDVVPVDFTAELIVRMGMQKSLYGNYFHLIDPEPIGIDRFFAVLHQGQDDLVALSFEDWSTKCLEFVRGMEDQSFAYILERFFIKTEHGRFIRGLLIDGKLSTERLLEAARSNGIATSWNRTAIWEKYIRQSGAAHKHAEVEL